MQRFKFLLPFLSAFLLGCLSALSMAPLSAWPLLFVSVSAFYILLQRAKSKRASFALGWLFGFGYFLCGLSWIGSALLVEDNGYRWAYPLAIMGIPFLLSFYWGIAGCLYFFARRRLPLWAHYLCFVVVYSLAEVIRGYAFTGFPWNLFGYTWAEILPIVQNVRWGSVYGLTALTWFWAGLGGAFYAVRMPKRTLYVYVLLGVVSFVACYGYGVSRLQGAEGYTPPALALKLVPGDVPQSEKWGRQYLMRNFTRYVQRSAADPSAEYNNPVLIVWPETAVAGWMLEDTGLRGMIVQMLSRYPAGSALVTGALRYEEDGARYYNSMVQVDQLGQVSNIYDKSHLVPFGEYIPFSDIIPLPAINRFSGFQAGGGPALYSLPSGHHYAPGICYEIIFPHLLLPQSSKKPDFIINVTNDAWYYGSAGPAQHYIQALYRAIEYDVPVVRVSNRGTSSVINPYGKIYQKNQ